MHQMWLYDPAYSLRLQRDKLLSQMSDRRETARRSRPIPALARRLAEDSRGTRTAYRAKTPPRGLAGSRSNRNPMAGEDGFHFAWHQARRVVIHDDFVPRWS